VIIKHLKYFVSKDQNDWDKYLPYATFSANIGYQKSLQISAYEALYGFPARIPSQVPHSDERRFESLREHHRNIDILRENAFKNLKNALQKSADYENESRHNPTEYKVNEEIWVKIPYVPAQFKQSTNFIKHQKLGFSYYGPFVVIKRLADEVYMAKNIPTDGERERPFQVHILNMKPVLVRDKGLYNNP